MSAACGDVILDDNMSAANYNSFSFNGDSNGTNFNDRSFALANPLNSGGNPDDTLLIEHTFDVFDSDPVNDLTVSLQSFHVDQSSLYNPTSDGAFQEVSFSVDVLYQAGVIETLFFIVDDSVGGQAAGFTAIAPSANWQTISVSGLTNASFSARDFAGNLDLKFGFGFISSSLYSGVPETSSLMVDNFRVNVSAIPEPASGFWLAVPASFVSFRRRRTP